MWDELNGLAVRSMCDLLFDLNVLLRDGKDWDYTNAAQLLQYTLNKSYASNIAWELGNGKTFTIEPMLINVLINNEISVHYK